MLTQWAVGSTEHWRRILADEPLELSQPQFLWDVDYFPNPPSISRLNPPAT